MPPWLSAMTTSTFSVSRRSFTISLAVSIGSANFTAPRQRRRSGFFAEHPEEAEAQAAALDHEVAADHPSLGQSLEVGQRGVIRS